LLDTTPKAKPFVMVTRFRAVLRKNCGLIRRWGIIFSYPYISERLLDLLACKIPWPKDHHSPPSTEHSLFTVYNCFYGNGVETIACLNYLT